MIYAANQYLNFLNLEKAAIENANYTFQAKEMQRSVSEMIASKQKSTIAMALSLTNDDRLLDDIKNKKISVTYYNDLIETFKRDTDYKNIWVQIIDKDLSSIYRSWSGVSGDSLAKVRNDLRNMAKSKKVVSSISSGKFTLSIKAMVPIWEKDKFVGVLEIISHFNSISKQMKKFDVESVVVLDKEFTQKLQYPFTKIFVNDYYIANFDASQHILKYIETHGVKNQISSSYIAQDGYIISNIELKSLQGRILGYYLMFKKIEDIPSLNLEFFMFKWLAIALVFVMTLAGIINITLFFFIRKQKFYYKKIIDSSTNIVLINDKRQMKDANKVFFEYFYKYASVAEFKKEHECLCDFFVEEDSYISKEVDGMFWVDYILENHNQDNKVKVKYYDNIYYFLVNASIVSEDKDYCSVVFSEITNEENYKKELELLSVTDSLTGVSNRRHFEKKMHEEIMRSIRYEHTLSLVMLDIDHFKRVNDIHGHGVGDSVLIEYSKLISSMLRDGDIFSRIGGEEFMIILPHADIEAAQAAAEKLREIVETYKKVIPITMSFGVTEYIKGEDISYILKRVDDALYEAKEAGRNKVVAR